ncbi:MAG: hypothetical protein CXZ00_08655 [Acidobacteria bacterium]|nr:MAG: hypothetical protein CXZ00_08655 [Acidobacteriota bacterium]
MPTIKFRVRFNEGRKGVPLEKLEKIAAELRRFLASISSDLEFPDSIQWLGSEFQNKSLSYNLQGDREITPEQSRHFNAGVEMLTKGELPPFLTDTTASTFYGIAKVLDPGERFRIGLYPKGRIRWCDLTQEKVVPIRKAESSMRYIGAIQGRFHAWYAESTPPFFYIRDLTSHDLIKCEYRDEAMYDEILKAIQDKRSVLHVHGEIRVNRSSKQIETVSADKMFGVRPFTMRDVDKFLNSGNVQ